jgi:tight adherence protein C
MAMDAPHRRRTVVIGTDPAAVATLSTAGPAAAALAAAALGAFARPRVSVARPRSLGLPAGRSSRTFTSRRAGRVSWLIAGAIVAWAAGPLVVGVAAATVLLGRRLGPMRAERRRRAAIARALPDAMDQLVAIVRAGLTPFQAVCDLAGTGEPEIRDAFADVVHRTERGQPFADALSALPDHLGAPAGGLADVIATSDRHGLALGPVLDQLAIENRATRHRLDQAEARKLPVRLSFPLVTCTLPSFVLLAIAPAVIAALSSLGATAW